MATDALEVDARAARLDDFAAAYGALARFLLGPADAELLAQLAEPGQLEAWPLARGTDASRGLQHIAASLEAHESEEALLDDYQRLFVGPGHLLAPPYESVHRTRDRLLFDTPTFQVRAAYNEFGMRAPRFGREPDDHLGLELSFLAHLCNVALDALEHEDGDGLERALNAQKRFLTDHLLCWGGDCLRMVEANATSWFYRGVGALGLGLLCQASSW